MIDFENQIFTMIVKSLRSKYGKGIFVTGENVSTIQKQFPAVSIIQKSNDILFQTRTMENNENHATVMIEVDVYSNLEKGKKQQAKEITALINDIFVEHNFVRIFSEPLDNLSDMKIYRIKSRFKAVIGKNGMIYTI